MRGNDLRGHGVKDEIVLPDSRSIRMSFCFEAFAIAEEIYAGVFNRDSDILGIIEDISGGMTAALQAVVYGAVAVVNKELSFKAFLEEVYSSGNKAFFQLLVIENLSKMFPDTKTVHGIDDGEKTEFPWELYYKASLAIGLTDADFWAGTPRKIWLLTRNKEDAERREWLTRNYV